MSSSEDEGSDNIPAREICEERCQSFATVTGTDSALAMFYLQDRDWDLQRALDAFFEDTTGTPVSAPAGTENSSETKPPGSKLGDKATATLTEFTDPEPHRIRVITWNIDGLDIGNLQTRTKAVADIINKEKPDVVYLQEVVPNSLPLIEERCTEYQIVQAGGAGYFTVMMLRLRTVAHQDDEISQFFSSMMGRNLLTVQASVKGIDMVLMTTHLESTKDHGDERKRQLRTALKKMQDCPKEKPVIFGGDLNLRDKEVGEIGGLPDDILDLWEVTGKRPEAKFTWDLTRNDNLEWDARFRPKCRFDRLYLRNTKPKSKLKPVYFELIGIERLEGCRRFPSDHWGILAHFDKC